MTMPASTGVVHAVLTMADRALERATRICFVFSGILLGALLGSYVLEVVARYFFSSPTTWTFDLGKAFMSTAVILALPEITRTRGNITIDVLLEKMSAATRVRFQRSIAVICFGVCMATAWICLHETLRQYATGIETFWNNPVPKWWISSFIPFGFALSGFHFLKHGLISQTGRA